MRLGQSSQLNRSQVFTFIFIRQNVGFFAETDWEKVHFSQKTLCKQIFCQLLVAVPHLLLFKHTGKFSFVFLGIFLVDRGCECAGG